MIFGGLPLSLSLLPLPLLLRFRSGFRSFNGDLLD